MYAPSYSTYNLIYHGEDFLSKLILYFIEKIIKESI